ncbi:MAG: hypothetical protein ACYTEL_12825 [Planctomycetota bacterium]|jgi:hypothetical protein
MENVLVGLIPLILIILGFVAGKYIEKQHLRSLAQKEAALRGIGVCNLRKFPVGSGGVEMSTEFSGDRVGRYCYGSFQGIRSEPSKAFRRRNKNLPFIDGKGTT